NQFIIAALIDARTILCVQHRDPQFLRRRKWVAKDQDGAQLFFYFLKIYLLLASNRFVIGLGFSWQVFVALVNRHRSYLFLSHAASRPRNSAPSRPSLVSIRDSWYSFCKRCNLVPTDSQIVLGNRRWHCFTPHLFHGNTVCTVLIFREP